MVVMADITLAGFVDVREPHTKRLLFRYDPARNLVEVQARGVKTVVDLATLTPKPIKPAS